MFGPYWTAGDLGSNSRRLSPLVANLRHMPKSNHYQRKILIFLLMVIFPSVKSVVSGDVSTLPVVNGPVTPASAAEIPAGFKTERYAKVWERNPFTLVTPASAQPPQSAFDKLFLTSWLKDGHQDVVFIQNLETNEVQKITTEPNQQHLRLISLHVGPSPQLVEALVSNGQEQGTLKFRIDSQPLAVQTPAAQMANAGTQSFTRRAAAETTGVSMGTDPRRIPRRGHGSEGVHLPLPQKSS